MRRPPLAFEVGGGLLQLFARSLVVACFSPPQDENVRIHPTLSPRSHNTGPHASSCSRNRRTRRRDEGSRGGGREGRSGQASSDGPCQLTSSQPEGPPALDGHTSTSLHPPNTPRQHPPCGSITIPLVGRRAATSSSRPSPPLRPLPNLALPDPHTPLPRPARCSPKGRT